MHIFFLCSFILCDLTIDDINLLSENIKIKLKNELGRLLCNLTTEKEKFFDQIKEKRDLHLDKVINVVNTVYLKLILEHKKAYDDLRELAKSMGLRKQFTSDNFKGLKEMIESYESASVSSVGLGDISTYFDQLIFGK